MSEGHHGKRQDQDPDRSRIYKNGIIRLKKQNKPITEIIIRSFIKCGQINQPPVWYILKKTASSSELRNTKRPRRPRNTPVVDEGRALQPGRKTP